MVLEIDQHSKLLPVLNKDSSSGWIIIVLNLETDIETIPEESMTNLDFMNRNVETDETRITVEIFHDREMNWDCLRDCDDSYAEILIQI